MANPVLCEVTRGDLVESKHRGVVAVVDADGIPVFTVGAIDEPIFPRSAVKIIQALPLIESGAADAFGFAERELALVCSSHGGEPVHVEIVSSMLACAGLTLDALECGMQWPSVRSAAAQLTRNDEHPSALHNNCSGKHTGMLCTCVHLGVPQGGYVGRDHLAQKEVAAILEALTGAPHGVDHCGVDGCSIPTHAVPLRSLALGFARMASGTGLEPVRAAAAKRLLEACMSNPLLVDGTNRRCTRLMEAGAGEVYSKNGAEGVYCGAIPSLGLGIAVKCDDGTMRGAETVYAAVVAKLVTGNSDLSGRFEALATSPVLSRNRVQVGEIRPAGEL